MHTFTKTGIAYLPIPKDEIIHNGIMEKIYDFHDFDFAQYPQILAVYLFGSRAVGKEHPNADVDIALIMNADFNLLQNYNLPLTISSSLEGVTGCKVDVVLFHKMDPLFQKEIRVKGRVVYVRDKEKLKRVLFKARKEFEDYLKIHKYYIRALKRRYAHCG